MIKAIFAVDRFGGMGFNGTLPWPHHSEDLSYFKEHTSGHIVVMGRNTWDDPKLPKPLKGRSVYVATNKPLKTGQGATPISGDIKTSLLELERLNPEKTIWVAGGAVLIEQCLEVLDEIKLTHHKGAYRTDTKVDLKRLLSGWQIRSASSGVNCAFVTYNPLFARRRS